MSVFEKSRDAPSSSGYIQLAVAAGLLAIGVIYSGYNLMGDLTVVKSASVLPYILLGVALTIALGFEFVNGFHDTANAVATVIYTHSLPPTVAVVWSGTWNFIGVLTSTGAVAFGIISLLPVELILQVGTGAGFAMVFALLVAAIVWNLGTWYFGIPNSSSHTLIGSIIGVGLMNQLLGGANGTSGVDWGQAVGIGRSLLFSPVVGFVLSGLLLLLSKAMLHIPKLYKEPEGKAPPPLWIRGLLVLTCTGVSFAHGSNDGQKGMGLIMLILIGTVPTAYALNRAMDEHQIPAFTTITERAIAALGHAPASAPAAADAQRDVTDYVRTRTLAPSTVPSLMALAGKISTEVKDHGSLARVPPEQVGNMRNEMYVASEALRLLAKNGQPTFDAADKATLKSYTGALNDATKFIPTWVKVAVAIALGLGTMVGWKRIVVTVGEKIGKQHLTYAQGAAAEIVAMVTIGAADMYGLPVSTTHVLSSGVAGTMAANRSGLQWGTLKSMCAAWVLTLPASIALAGGLYWLFRTLFA
jgi:PiT family inorganic phosphate transporter